MTELDDSEVREQATDPRRSVLLQAPAGSGKTTVLIQRLLRLLAEVEAPEQVLAITFTRKAAAEMRARIMRALQPGMPPRDAVEARTQALARQVLERSVRLGWDLERQPGRLRIQTLDALNQRLASSLPVSARLGGAVETTDDAAELYRRSAATALREAEQDAGMQRHSGLWLARVGNDWPRLETLIAELLARRNHWLRHVGGSAPSWLRERVCASLVRLVTDEIADVEAVLESRWLAAGEAHVRAGCAALIDSGGEPPPSWLACLGEPPPLQDASTLPLQRRVLVLRAIADLALTSSDKATRRRKVDRRQGFPPDAPRKSQVLAWLEAGADEPAMLAALRRLRRLPDPGLSPADGEALESLVELLQYAAAQLLLVFAEAGQADHAAISAAARQALTPAADEAPAALGEIDLIQHILVDEFQDTSIEQFELLERLVQAWQPGEARSLFLVGDPMQSIYQFREAEVALFMRARDRGVGHWRLEPMALRRNFRSSAAVVDFVNSTFARVFPPHDDRRAGAVAYLASEPAGAEGPLPAGVRLHRFGAGDREAEALGVLEIVRAARSAAPECSIALLVANRAHARRITAVLRAAGIGVRGVDLVPLGEVPAVLDLIALARALASPWDRIAWLAVLRAPWCGLALPALTAWLEREPQTGIAQRLLARDVSGCDRTDAARLRRVADVYASLLPQLTSMPLAAAVEAAWLQLGGPLVAARGSDAADAQAFFVALRLAEAHGTLEGAADIERVADRLFAAAGDDGAAIEVMTIHRSKGLEFDCVILPGLGRSGRNDREPLLDWFEWTPADHEPELVLAPIGAASEPPGRLATWLQALRSERREHERARLLYVAATRARRALHLLAETPAPVADGSVGKPRAGTSLATLWPTLGADWLAVAERSSGTRASSAVSGGGTAGEPAGPTLLRLPADWRAPEWPAVPGVDAAATGADVLREAVEFSWAGETARQIGVVVHRELQRWAQHGAPGGVDEQRLRRLLHAEGVGADELEPALLRASAALRGTLADQRGRWLLDPSHRQSRCELALTGVAAGRVQSIVIDRSFVDAEGIRWVVDYKTSAHEGGDLEGFIASERHRYRAQLLRYAAFARELGPEPVRAALYFPLLARFEEIETDGG
jgi:ATP-dependent exoDNAse (exonuclease V) beta subunit